MNAVAFRWCKRWNHFGDIMTDKDRTTTIALKQYQKDMLDKEGLRGETYSDILERLLRELKDYRRRCG